MKTPALLLALAVFATGAHAAPNFIGRFKPDAANCNNGWENYVRVYAKIGADIGVNAKSIQYTAYGDEARGVHVLLGSGSRQALGTVPSVHGQVTESWTQTTSGNTLVSIKSTDAPSRNIHFTETTTLIDHGQVLEIQEKLEAPGKPAKTESCRLVRY